MGRTIRVYIAGPYTKGDPGENTHIAIEWGEQIWEAGFVPYVPHLTYFWQSVRPHVYAEWLAYDMHWLDVCDCVFRFPGESPGAEKEIDRAKAQGMPVFYNVQQLRDYYREER